MELVKDKRPSIMVLDSVKVYFNSHMNGGHYLDVEFHDTTCVRGESRYIWINVNEGGCLLYCHQFKVSHNDLENVDSVVDLLCRFYLPEAIKRFEYESHYIDKYNFKK